MTPTEGEERVGQKREETAGKGKEVPRLAKQENRSDLPKLRATPSTQKSYYTVGIILSVSLSN